MASYLLYGNILVNWIWLYLKTFPSSTWVFMYSRMNERKGIEPYFFLQYSALVFSGQFDSKVFMSLTASTLR